MSEPQEQTQPFRFVSQVAHQCVAVSLRRTIATSGRCVTSVRKLLIFKGGTALKLCHFGNYRFSEYLDFTLAWPADFAEIRNGLEEVYQQVAQASGINLST
jgi:hypothetical protein